MNPKMKQAILLFIFLALLSSCKTYSYFDEFAIVENVDRLPSLTPIVDQQIVDRTGSEMNEGDVAIILKQERLGLVESSFRQYVLEGLTDPTKIPVGYTRLRINHFEMNNDLLGLSSINALSFGILQMVGIPYGRIVAHLDVSIEVMDDDHQILGIYNAKSQKKTWIAMYYGYTSKDAYRRSLSEAIEEAIRKINRQILKDFSRLDAALRN